MKNQLKKLHKKYETRRHTKHNYTTLEQIQSENDKKYFEMMYDVYNSNGKLGDHQG
jgi:hypothetical protein